MLTIKNVGKLLNNTFKDKIGMEWYVDKIITDPKEYLIVVEQRYAFKKEVVALSREVEHNSNTYVFGISNGGISNQRIYKSKRYITKVIIEDKKLLLNQITHLIDEIIK